jgi:hypothetical protein
MTLASAVVRSMIGRWNTMACVSGRGQRRLPPLGCSRPWIRRSSVLLPAPLGPSTTVRVRREREGDVLDDVGAAFAQAEAGGGQPGVHHPHRLSAQPRRK